MDIIEQLSNEVEVWKDRHKRLVDETVASAQKKRDANAQIQSLMQATIDSHAKEIERLKAEANPELISNLRRTIGVFEDCNKKLLSKLRGMERRLANAKKKHDDLLKVQSQPKPRRFINELEEVYL